MTMVFKWMVAAEKRDMEGIKVEAVEAADGKLETEMGSSVSAPAKNLDVGKVKTEMGSGNSSPRRDLPAEKLSMVKRRCRMRISMVDGGPGMHGMDMGSSISSPATATKNLGSKKLDMVEGRCCTGMSMVDLNADLGSSIWSPANDLGIEKMETMDEGGEKLNMERGISIWSPPPVRKRNKNPGIRRSGNRVYDPENGKSCHQCRQKTLDFMALCTNKKKKGDKQCSIKYCLKCLLNRYGEIAEEVERLGNWVCPKCREICNCSLCMKKRGQKPTGIFVHYAKSKGCNSVLDYLEQNGSAILETWNSHGRDKGVISSTEKQYKKSRAVHDCDTYTLVADGQKKGLEMVSVGVGGDFKVIGKKRRRRTGGEEVSQQVLGDQQLDGTDASVPRLNNQRKRLSTVKSEPLQKISKHSENVVLPQATPLVEVGGVEFPQEDVGAALQFLEFCNGFSKVLGIEEGHDAAILQEISRGCVQRGSSSLTVQFCVKLLSKIRKHKGQSGTSWLNALKEFICDSKDPMNGTSFNCDTEEEFEKLNPSIKLRILNFICDGTLETDEFRCSIERANLIYIQRKKKAKEKIIEARKKEKDLKQMLKLDATNSLLSPEEEPRLSAAEHADCISQIKAETEKAHTEMLESVDLLPKMEERADAFRTKPLLLDGSGRAYWTLGCFNRGSTTLYQDIGDLEVTETHDRWFFYNKEDERTVEKYISSVRRQRSRRRKLETTVANAVLEDLELLSRHFTLSASNSEGNCSVEPISQPVNCKSEQVDLE